MSKESDLLPANYEKIRGAMVDLDQNGLPSALDDMTSRKLCLPHYQGREVPLSRYDTSFTRQMWDVYNNPDRRPDVVIGTVWSGIPPLDAVRGFYEELGVKSPIFLPLHVGQLLGHAYQWDNSLGKVAGLQARKLANDLEKALSGTKVLIVEEYVRSGKAIELCGKIARQAGAATVMGMRGDWYDNARHQDVDLENLTSTHAAFMRSIGHEAAQVTTPPQVA